MTTNTNSAHERTASIDPAQLIEEIDEVLSGEILNIGRQQRLLRQSREVLARRSLTSGAPAEDGCGCQQGQCCNVCDPIHDGTAPISGKASEVKVWLKAETASREAIKAYNAAVAESDRHIWPGTDINAEFQIMSAAKNKAFQAMHAMYDAMSGGAAAKTEQADGSVIDYGTTVDKSDGTALTVEKDAARLDWLNQNFFSDQKDEWDERQSPNSIKWKFFGPMSIQGDVRRVIDAAIEAHNKAGKEQDNA